MPHHPNQPRQAGANVYTGLTPSMNELPRKEDNDQWNQCLIKVAEERDRAAFETIFNHYAPLIKAFALKAGASSSQLAEELVQEVMIKIWRKSSKFDSTKASASTWIFTIARNTRIDLLRKQQIIDSKLVTDDIWDMEEDVSKTPFLMLQQRRDKQFIQESLDELPINQREVLGKVYMEGLSHAEVSEQLGLPLGTVKSRIRLALKKLQVLVDR